jgi:PDZ domain-containing protein
LRPALLGFDRSVAGCPDALDCTPAVTTIAQMPRMTTQSTKGITPPRMVTPTEPNAHGASADPGDEGAAVVPSASPDADAPADEAATAPPELEPNGDRAGQDAPDVGRDQAPDAGSPAGPPPAPFVAPPQDAPPADGPPPPEGSQVDAPGPPLQPPPPPVTPRRRRRGRIALGVAAFLLTAFLIGAAFVPLPYYLFKPGSVHDTEPLITVSGAEVYPSDGSIGYTTVSLRQATLLGLAQGWLDDDIDVVPRDDVLSGRDVNENRELNLQMMTDSKEVATFVALDRLGYDVSMMVGQAVSDVVPDSPADGLIEPGDVITAIDGEQFDDPDDLSRLLADEAPGDHVTVSVQTAPGRGEDVELALVASPDDPSRAIMGVQVAPVAIDFEFPFPVTIDTGDVGGPSAGLAFTLALIDDLTPGDLTGGADVAVTGTIQPDGSVGPIGGAGQKAAAVRRDGLDLFLVPSDDYEDAVAHAGDDLEVVAVDTIDEALEALGDHGGNVDDLPEVGESAAGVPH